VAIPDALIDTAPLAGPWSTEVHRDLLREVLAGVELFDRRILDWLADWDGPTVVTIVSLILRARTTGSLATPSTSSPDDPRRVPAPPPPLWVGGGEPGLVPPEHDRGWRR
jgi:hypothetical protein